MESCHSCRYWVAVASREHVSGGVAGGFCQLCHGKAAPLRRMEPGDWIAYYSPKMTFGGSQPCQAFTAIGRVAEGPVFSHPVGDGFVPSRRCVDFLECREAPVLPLVDGLSFIRDKKRWGAPFRFGFLEVCRDDFALLASAMGVPLEEEAGRV